MSTHLAEHYSLTREFTYSVVLVDEDHEVLEVVALSNNGGVADAAFNAALTRYSHTLVQMRNVSRIMRTVKTGPIGRPF